MNVNRVIGLLFIGAFPAVMFFCAWSIWPHPFAWACIAVGFIWMPALLTGLGVVPTSRDIDESAEIETINIALISLDQRGNKNAPVYVYLRALQNRIEHHPAYEDNSGVRRWKVSRSDWWRKTLTKNTANEAENLLRNH